MAHLGIPGIMSLKFPFPSRSILFSNSRSLPIKRKWIFNFPSRSWEPKSLSRSPLSPTVPQSSSSFASNLLKLFNSWKWFVQFRVFWEKDFMLRLDGMGDFRKGLMEWQERHKVECLSSVTFHVSKNWCKCWHLFDITQTHKIYSYVSLIWCYLEPDPPNVIKNTLLIKYAPVQAHSQPK